MTSKKVCKMVDAAIKDERMAGWKEYPELEMELGKLKRPIAQETVYRIGTDEQRHYEKLRKIRKSLGCK